VDGQETVAFRADDQGRTTYLFQNNLPIMGYHKLAWYETLPLHYSLLVECVVLFLSTLVVWPLEPAGVSLVILTDNLKVN
jgi:hypothetical protein